MIGEKTCIIIKCILITSTKEKYTDDFKNKLEEILKDNDKIENLWENIKISCNDASDKNIKMENKNPKKSMDPEIIKLSKEQKALKLQINETKKQI